MDFEKDEENEAEEMTTLKSNIMAYIADGGGRHWDQTCAPEGLERLLQFTLRNLLAVREMSIIYDPRETLPDPVQAFIRDDATGQYRQVVGTPNDDYFDDIARAIEKIHAITTGTRTAQPAYYYETLEEMLGYLERAFGCRVSIEHAKGELQ